MAAAVAAAGSLGLAADGGGAAAALGPLQTPLLEDPDPVQVEVWEFSREWSEFETTDSDGAVAGAVARSERYRNAAAALASSVGSAAHGVNEPLGPPLFYGRSTRGCVICCFYFVQQNMYTLSVVTAFCFRRWFAFICMAPPWVALVVFETWLAFHDRRITATIQRLRRQVCFCTVFAYIGFVFLCLGCCFGYLLVRARRHWRCKNQLTFIAELAAFGKSEPNRIDATRLDTLVRFLCGVPALTGLPWILAVRSRAFTWFELLVYSSVVFVSVVDLVVALVDFDFSVSRHIRTQFGMKFEHQEWYQSPNPKHIRFQAMHAASRLTEVSGRVLVLVAAALASMAHPWLAATWVAVDFYVGAISLQWVSGCSLKAALISIPLFLVDVACYIDESGVGVPARKLSKYCFRLRTIGMAAAATVYASISMGTMHIGVPSLGGVPLEVCFGCLLVALAVSNALLRAAVAPPAVGSGGGGGVADDGLGFCSPPQGVVEVASLKELFGKQLGFAAGPRQRRDVASFMFSNSMGEQLEQLREGINNMSSQAQTRVRLWNLKTVSSLGSGGFGKVLKVQDVSSGEFFAMKLQQKGKGSKCAVREAQVLCWSEHPFTVRLVQVFQTAELFGILLEFCEHDLNHCLLRTLSAAGRAEGLPRPRAARYSVCMMLALEHLHGKRIVFRDLKPENVLITSEERGDHAKLTDFGLARPLDRLPGGLGDVSPMYMSPGAGTPAFMAREAFMHAAPVFHKGGGATEFQQIVARDWYSFGCCMLLMLLGEDGGRRVGGADRQVLLPPPAEDIPPVLRCAANQHRMPEEACQLIAALTAPAAADRAGASDLRRCAWLRQAREELEAEMIAMVGSDKVAELQGLTAAQSSGASRSDSSASERNPAACSPPDHLGASC